MSIMIRYDVFRKSTDEEGRKWIPLEIEEDDALAMLLDSVVFGADGLMSVQVIAQDGEDTQQFIIAAEAPKYKKEAQG